MDSISSKPESKKSFNGVFALILAGWVASFIVSLAVIGGIGYVAWHFISKFW